MFLSLRDLKRSPQYRVKPCILFSSIRSLHAASCPLDNCVDIWSSSSETLANKNSLSYRFEAGLLFKQVATFDEQNINWCHFAFQTNKAISEPVGLINYAVANCGYVTRRLFAVVGECIVLGLNSDIVIFNLTLRSKFHVIHIYKQQVIVCNNISLR